MPGMGRLWRKRKRVIADDGGGFSFKGARIASASARQSSVMYPSQKLAEEVLKREEFSDFQTGAMSWYTLRFYSPQLEQRYLRQRYKKTRAKARVTYWSIFFLYCFFMFRLQSRKNDFAQKYLKLVMTPLWMACGTLGIALLCTETISYCKRRTELFLGTAAGILWCAVQILVRMIFRM